MSIRNRFYNWWHNVKRYRGKGCKNAAYVGNIYGIKFVTKYDWSKPFIYQSKPIEFGVSSKDNGIKEAVTGK